MGGADTRRHAPARPAGRKFEVTSSPGSAEWRRSIGGGFMLWVGTLAFGLSTVLLLALITRHKSLASVAALLGLAFVASLIPAGLQLRTAALVVDGGRLPRIAPRILVLFTVVGVVVAPGLALLLKLPVLSILLVVVQVVIGIPLATSRGAWLGTHRFSALGTNMVIEAVAWWAWVCLVGGSPASRAWPRGSRLQSLSPSSSSVINTWAPARPSGLSHRCSTRH